MIGEQLNPGAWQLAVGIWSAKDFAGGLATLPRGQISNAKSLRADYQLVWL
jgi:hypothetical protein